ncbi:MAG: KTSC domain-containing protein [Elusimicrobia bacterium]|nr:KTSC domain-containing protein [Elusimicrobiota bacterium]
MIRIPVQSSNIVAIGHDPVTRDLEVEFKTGVYVYSDVPADAFKALMAAPSVGNHLHTHIKPKYRAEKLGAPKAPPQEDEPQPAPLLYPMITPRAAVAWFAQMIEANLQTNDGTKPDWATQEDRAIFLHLLSEVMELGEAIVGGNPACIISEASDVGACAMMLADKRRDRPSRDRGAA